MDLLQLWKLRKYYNVLFACFGPDKENFNEVFVDYISEVSLCVCYLINEQVLSHSRLATCNYFVACLSCCVIWKLLMLHPFHPQ